MADRELLPREFWDLLHEWSASPDEERRDWIENRFGELFALASMTAVIEQPTEQPQSSVHLAVNDAGQGSQAGSQELPVAAPSAEGSAPCDTPAYCNSVRRCTRADSDPARKCNRTGG